MAISFAEGKNNTTTDMDVAVIDEGHRRTMDPRTHQSAHQGRVMARVPEPRPRRLSWRNAGILDDADAPCIHR